MTDPHKPSMLGRRGSQLSLYVDRCGTADWQGYQPLVIICCQAILGANKATLKFWAHLVCLLAFITQGR